MFVIAHMLIKKGMLFLEARLTPWWHVYLRVEVAALLHKCADCKPKTVGQAELVDSSQ